MRLLALNRRPVAFYEDVMAYCALDSARCRPVRDFGPLGYIPSQLILNDSRRYHLPDHSIAY
jgi:hypothetical protein